MNKTIYLFCLLFVYTAYGQSLIIYDVDASSFPNMKAKIFALDEQGNQISDLSKYNLFVEEEGSEKVGARLKCSSPKPLQAISSVLTIDVSGSMCGEGLDIAKAGTKAWLLAQPFGKSECAISSYDHYNYFVHDFSKNRNSLIKSVDDLQCKGGTDFNAGFLEEPAGALLVSEYGQYKKIVVFLTDGNSNGNENEIINKANEQNTVIYCVSLDNVMPEILENISSETGGLYFYNITSKQQAENTYRHILMHALGLVPCEIEWISKGCQTERKSKLTFLKIYEGIQSSEYLAADFNYSTQLDNIPHIKYSPAISVSFGIKEPGTSYTEKISLTAHIEPLNIRNIKGNNPRIKVIEFGGSPPPFVLKPRESRDLVLEFKTDDSSYTYAKFDIESQACFGNNFYASGGDPKKRAVNQTIKLIFPNGAEELIAGSDTTITWDGVSPADNVHLEYSIDGGKSWQTITEDASGLSHKWRVPVPLTSDITKPSDILSQVLLKATIKEKYDIYPKCGKEIAICNQIWMGCNLDVEHYRNGDLIPEIKSDIEWMNTKTGAWCYYDNDPENGKIYGKLYNWYAVNDPRGLAPEGWHIPTDYEWTELENCLGGKDIAGAKLKESGTIHWKIPNTGASNETGFSAFPGGWRSFYTGGFDRVGFAGYWWSASENNMPFAWNRYLSYNYPQLERYYYCKPIGFSVRCIKNK